MIRESVRRSTPRFVTEGYAVYEGGNFYRVVHNGVEKIIGKKIGLDFIDIAPNAPSWAKEEFAEWMEKEKELEVYRR